MKDDKCGLQVGDMGQGVRDEPGKVSDEEGEVREHC